MPNRPLKEEAIDGAREDVRLPGGETETKGGVGVEGVAVICDIEGEAVVLAGVAVEAATFEAFELAQLASPDPHAPIVALAVCALSLSLAVVVGDNKGAGVVDVDCAGGVDGAEPVPDAVGVRRRPTPSESGLRPPPFTGTGGASENVLPRRSVPVVEVDAEDNEESVDVDADATELEFGNALSAADFGLPPSFSFISFNSFSFAAAIAAFCLCTAMYWLTSLLTPSNALKSVVEPEVIAEEMASFVDSRFLSSLRS